MSIRSSDRDPFKNGRYYHLPTLNRSLAGCEDWDELSGALRSAPLSRSQFTASLAKAQRGSYQAVMFPSNSVLHPDFEFFLNETTKAQLQPVYQLPASWLHRLWAQKDQLFESHSLAFEIVMDDVPGDTTLLESIQQRFPTHFTMPGLRQAPVWQKLSELPPVCYQNLHFYFPYFGDRKKIFKTTQVMNLLESIKKNHPMAVIRSPLGVDIHEPRIEPHRDLEPLVQPVIRREASAKPKVSVVIPAFNNGSYLANVLRHLERQTLERSAFEVIVVDDGSEDNTSELILAAAEKTSMPLTVIYYPRSRKRQMGDSQFRAGLARNLGVKWASGELLVFVDSDIILPQDFLEKTIELHKTHDVVQWRRDYLNKAADSTTMDYERVDRARDCFIPEGGYWHDFYGRASESGWSALPDHWKYVCTYGLSLSRKTFCQLGWFRKTYCFYGFEDTDLGLRLWQNGYSFHFHNEPVYHLFHETERSEFQNSTVLRQKLLQNTARIFYHNNLSGDIYRVFKYLLRDTI